MKNLLIAAIATSLCISNVYANKAMTFVDTSEINTGVHAWRLKDMYQGGYGFLGSDVKKVRIMVANTHTVKYQNFETDKVKFNCNGKFQYLKPGNWTICNIKSDFSAGFSIDRGDFVNGASGMWEAISK